MTDDGSDLLVDELVRDRYRLFRIAWSSPGMSVIFLPSTPPFSFHSLTASSAAFRRSTPILL
jgi:hypothetical protein